MRMQDKIKITYIESPINQISHEMLEEKLSPTKDEPKQPENDKFKDISKRLESNLRKIESIEIKNPNSGRQFNFKMLKNTLISNDHANKMKEQATKTAEKLKVNQTYFTPGKEHSSFLSNGSSKGKHSYNYLSANDKIHHSNQKHETLETCLNQLKEIKRTIKNLKETCQNGTGYERVSKLSISNEYRPERSRKKYTTSSLSKYKYSNYRDFSQVRSNKSQERSHYSDKKTNWLRNEKVQEFTIDASGEDE